MTESYDIFELLENEPKRECLKTLPNWFKRSLSLRTHQLKKLKNIQIKRCGVCDARFISYFNDSKTESFQANDCASWVYESHNIHWLSTSYGSSFDGSVFKIHDMTALKEKINCCDNCIAKRIKSKSIEFVYDYFYREYNPKFEELVKEVYGDKFETLKPSSEETLNYFNKYTQE